MLVSPAASPMRHCRSPWCGGRRVAHGAMSAPQRLFFGLLMLALLLAPLLGQLHRTLHGPVLLARVACAPSIAEAPGGRGAVPEAAGLSGVQLFADHLGETDCRLYDQLAQGDLLPGVPTLASLPLLPAAITVHRLAADAVARRAALFDARGPPATR